MTNRLLDDTDALTLTLQQLLEENDFTRSLHRLRNFSAVNKYSRGYLNAHNAELARRLLGADMGMSPLDLATMILDMSISFRANLVHLAEQWNTPHAIEFISFFQCNELAIRKLSSFVTAIGNSAFNGCPLLNVVEWDAPLLTDVSDYAFSRCTSLTLKTWQSPKLSRMGDYAFADCTSLTLETWQSPELSRVGGQAFKGCTSLIVAEWHATLLTFMGHSVFKDCTSLTLKTWQSPKLSLMGDQVFAGCKALVLSTWHSTALTKIPMRTFNGCVSLTLVNWHAPLLTVIGEQAFAGCSALVWETGCHFPPGIKIEDGAFRGCTSLSATARSEIAAINENALDPV